MGTRRHRQYSNERRTRIVLVGLALVLLSGVSRLNCAKNEGGKIESLAISPDGNTIAFSFRKNDKSFIYLADTENGVARRLTKSDAGGELQPSFSPDGKRIAYSYWPQAQAHSTIVIINADGSGQRTWSPPDANYFSPVFSPDNKRIVFSRSGFFGNYSPIARPHPHEWSFYASDLDGSNLRQLTNESFYMASTVSVSPDGNTVAVVTEGLETNRRISIYSLMRSGPPVRTLQPHVPNEADRKDPIFNAPNYGNDGKHIFFMAASNGRHGYDYDIYGLDLETGGIERFTTGNGYATALKVSADGRTAIFLKWRSDWHSTPVESEVYMLDLKTHNLRPLRITGLN